MHQLIRKLNLFDTHTILLDNFQNKTKFQIKNSVPTIEPGVALGIFNPSGSELRKLMEMIIRSDGVDNILDTDINKMSYQKAISDEIDRKPNPIIKIQKTNLSQDEATISALKQDTIIWGPPGTGKSQTIVNVIANILNKDKTAFIVSQKKVALEVLRERLNTISKFCLFVLDKKQISKKDFYQPLQELEKAYSNFDSRLSCIDNKNQILNNNNKNYIQKSRDVIGSKEYKINIKLMNYLNDHKIKIKMNSSSFRMTMNTIFKLDKNFFIQN